MNSTPTTRTRQDGIVTAIGVLVLLLGTATGNAYVMLAMSIVAIGLIAVFFRQRLKRSLSFVMIVAAMTAAVVAFAVTKL